MHPIDQLPEDRPWGFRVLGKALVAWKDGEGQWRVFEDACPHRRVPLSEGRKEEDGTLSCAYHGWRFDGALLQYYTLISTTVLALNIRFSCQNWWVH